MGRGKLVATLCAAAVTALLAPVAAVPAAGAEPGPAAGAQQLRTAGAPVPTLNWGACPKDALTQVPPELRKSYQCDNVEVPLSYRRPNGQSIRLAVGRLPATDQAHKLGTLFYNPGGPGGSGRIPPPFSARLHKRFDLVGFDPRGTNASTPAKCFTSTQQALRDFGWQFPITPKQEQRVVAATKRGTDLCGKNAGPVLSHMSTANVARDMDLLRKAVGDEKLTYLGFSYGTHLGEVYANLFPDKVRAIVLDGVLDPREWTTGQGPGQEFVPFTYRLGSFGDAQRALGAFLRACAADERCAFGKGGKTPAQLQAKYDTLLDRLREKPAKVTAPDGTTSRITYQLAVSVTLQLLYSAHNSPALAETLQQLYTATNPAARTLATPPRVDMPDVPRHPGFTPRARAADSYPGVESFYAVSCLDSSNPGNPYEVGRYARKADTRAPGFGSVWTYRALPCATWPTSDPDRYAGPWNRKTANPILTVGNSQGDPATPYDDAEATTGLLADARLLTLDSFGHTGSYILADSSCVDRRVDSYLIDKQLPPAGTVCKPDRKPFDPPPAPSSG